MCRKYNIRKVFITITTPRRQLTRIKDMEPFLRRAGVIRTGYHVAVVKPTSGKQKGPWKPA